MEKECKYCEKAFEKKFNNQKYCNDFCKDRATKIKKRIRQKKLHGTDKHRRCTMCKRYFNHYDMKNNCKDCLILLKEKPHLYRKIKKKTV